MKHAYLIIAHHEFEVLKRLVEALDDERNDIYIHFDKKVESLPVIVTEHASLYIIKNRIDVRWGDVSQIATEFALFEEAVQHGPYGYYHLLSGVDMPIRSQDFIHLFFTLYFGKEFIGFDQRCCEKEIDKKVRRYHLFSGHFKRSGGVADLCRRGLRYLFLRMQYIFGIRRHRGMVFKKGSNWVSVTECFVRYLLSEKNRVMETYQHSFCADEIFLQTICWNSAFREKLFNPADDGLGCMRRINWKGNRVVDWQSRDFDELMDSNALFARKFSSKDLALLDRITDKIRRDVEKVD